MINDPHDYEKDVAGRCPHYTIRKDILVALEEIAIASKDWLTCVPYIVGVDGYIEKRDILRDALIKLEELRRTK